MVPDAPTRHTGGMTAPQHGRLPWPTRDDLDPARREVYDAILSSRRPAGDGATAGPNLLHTAEGRLHGPFNMMVQASAPVGSALQRLGGALRFGGGLSDRVRELAILTVAAVRGSEFEWLAHTGAAAAAGLTDDQLEALARGDGALFDGVDALVHAAVTELVSTGDLRQTSVERCRDELGAAGLVDLVVLVGYYQLLATALRTFRAPLPE